MVLIAVLSAGLLAPVGVAQAAATVPRGTTDGFAIPAGSAITHGGPSTVTGDVGLHEGSSDGRGDITQNASLHVADGMALQAKAYWVLIIALVLFITSAFSYRNGRA